ncbi:hypothetical protein [Amycolatopsis sp. FDAARGOS 1241]|uniref:hypothetical protein n=1 Tax=Amycolatopsis sp. FDAARGOS 1241 TaxID=2778070 RepID=UPI0019515024|nr:hypothetical protein [Amycolatopsis sp. FDAARGOS 1241]QRP45869.1 hypothetical protein I6J71_43510 [Amycolatopsis sp. FDAARGOS 1241]
MWGQLRALVQQRLFTGGNYSEMWPLGPDSPAHRGRPRNIKVRWIEDSLLEPAQDVDGIELVAEPYSQPKTWDGVDVLAICDGARSKTREDLEDAFGTASRDLYSVGGKPLDETVLGIRVEAKLPDEHTLPLAVCQNRFLFNSLGGGFINMRLTAEEASAIVAYGEHGPVECIGKFGCTMRPDCDKFVCDRHRSAFKPSVDKLSFRWPRIADGIKFFAVSLADVVASRRSSWACGRTRSSLLSSLPARSVFCSATPPTLAGPRAQHRGEERAVARREPHVPRGRPHVLRRRLRPARGADAAVAVPREVPRLGDDADAGRQRGAARHRGPRPRRSPEHGRPAVCWPTRSSSASRRSRAGSRAAWVHWRTTGGIAPASTPSTSKRSRSWSNPVRGSRAKSAARRWP